MAGTVPIEVRLADLPQVQAFLASVNALLVELGQAGDLPGPVMEAVARLRGDAAALARDTAPQPAIDAYQEASNEIRYLTGD